jgi:hypothetical protein
VSRNRLRAVCRDGYIADRVRSDFGHGRWSSETLAQVAEASRAYANVRDGVE